MTNFDFIFENEKIKKLFSDGQKAKVGQEAIEAEFNKIAYKLIEDAKMENVDYGELFCQFWDRYEQNKKDNIDVSHCVHFYKNNKCGNTCHWFCTPCDWVETKECVYKQLQHEKAENQHFKDYIKKTKMKELKKLQNLKAKTIRRDVNKLTPYEFAKKYVKNGYFATEQEAKDYWENKA